MKTYLSILRGINVGGHKLIKMEALRKSYSDLGYQNIQTYIQSGNVIFQTSNTNQKSLEEAIVQKILADFSFEVPVIVKEFSELKNIIEKNPFLQDSSKNLEYLHVTFLSEEPKKTDFEKISLDKYLPDEFKLIDNSIYLYCPNSYSKTKLTNNFFESKLKVTATTRNWKTTIELLKIAEKTNCF